MAMKNDARMMGVVVLLIRPRSTVPEESNPAPTFVVVCWTVRQCC